MHNREQRTCRANSQSECQYDGDRVCGSRTEQAKRVFDVAGRFVHPPKPTRIAQRFLEAFDSTQTRHGDALRFLSTHPVALIHSCFTRNVEAQFRFEFGVNRRRHEEASRTKPGHANETDHVGLITSCTASMKRAHSARSAASIFSPAAVRR